MFPFVAEKRAAEYEAKPGPSKRKKLEGDVPLDVVKDVVQNITSPTLMIGPEVYIFQHIFELNDSYYLCSM